MKRKIINKNSGFTLVEILVAVSIFVAASAIAISAFTLSSNAQIETEAMRDTAQTENLILETISRDIRMSDNIVFCSDESCAQETIGDNLSCNYSTNYIKIASLATGNKIYGFFTDSDNLNKLGMQACDNSWNNCSDWQPLVPGGYEITKPSSMYVFSGCYKKTGVAYISQPFVNIEFNITNFNQTENAKKQGEKVVQTVKTSVSQRSYQFGSWNYQGY